ncbi:MAG: bacteriohemerythrin [Acidobacteriota bacterium]|jgi:hemerythrin|nr:bacteriohemerythrin [Acidobacteriota bacterium]
MSTVVYEWSSDIETGNAQIDAQHKELIKAINNLLEACSQGKGKAEIGTTVDFLHDYTVKHFTDEQMLQQRYGYPDYARHKQLHDGFTALVRNLADQMKRDGPTVALVVQVSSNVGDWLINHIKKEDKKVAAHIKGTSKKLADKA